MKRDRIMEVLNLLYDESLEAEFVSPNFVADFSLNRGIELERDEVILVSDLYGTSRCPTGRADELENFERMKS